MKFTAPRVVYVRSPSHFAGSDDREGGAASNGGDVGISDFLQAVKDEVVEEIVDHTLNETLLRVVNGEEVAGVDLQRDTRASYEALKLKECQGRGRLH